MQKKALKFIVIFCLFLLFLSFSFTEPRPQRGEGGKEDLFSLTALAQERKLEVEYPEIKGIKPETVAMELPEYVRYLFNFGIIIAGFILFGALIYGGARYLTSTGNLPALIDAREQILAAFLGIIILLSSYIILTTINPQLIVFHLGPLVPLEKVAFVPPEPIEPEVATLISRELPIGQAIEEGIWEEKRTNQAKQLFEDFEDFLNEKINITPPVFKIADLNKYLKTLTEECQCGNLDAFCTKPWGWSMPIGCSGDPCKEKVKGTIGGIAVGDIVGKETTREKMEEVLKINEEKMKKLLDSSSGWLAKISKEKNDLEIELSKFDDIEHEILACQSQAAGIYTLNEYLDVMQSYEEQGGQAATLPDHFESHGDTLTFYCSIGGTVSDFPYSSDFSPEESVFPEEFVMESASCPVVIPVGEAIDQFRELAVLFLVKMERTMFLIEEMAKEIRNMADLVSQCNEENCTINCACVPNPLHLIFPFLFPSPCLQAVGVCSGDPCPHPEIEETTEKIKEIEDEIFITLKEIREIFPQVSFLLKDKENPFNLQNLRTSIGLCHGFYSEAQLEPDWLLLNCEEAIGNYGPGGQIIGNCHPRNFYCCTFTRAELPDFPSVIKDRPITILPSKKYEPLPSENNCPKGWDCNQDVRYYNTYKDASEPLKELLSCMRERLDAVQEEKEIEKTLGRITSISDNKLYEGTCSWEAGPEIPGGCTHIYSIESGKESVSAHYGGVLCRYQRASYAVDIGVRDSDEKKYANEIIKAAKECNPSSYILYDVPGHYDHIHISIAAVYHCGAN